MCRVAGRSVADTRRGRGWCVVLDTSQNGDKSKTATTKTVTIKTATCQTGDTSKTATYQNSACLHFGLLPFWICHRFGCIQNDDTPKRRQIQNGDTSKRRQSNFIYTQNLSKTLCCPKQRHSKTMTNSKQRHCQN